MKTNSASIRMDIPTSQEMLTPRFLGQVLKADVRSVTILNNRVGSGHVGSLVQVALDYGMASMHLPRTMMAKFSSFDERIRMISNELGFFEREVRFYNEIASTMDLRTPHCYYAAFDPVQGRSLLLLEDLSGYHFESWPAGCSMERARQAVQEMAKLHAAWWNRPELAGIPWLFHAPEGPGLSALFVECWDGVRTCLQLGPLAENPRIVDIIQQELPAVEHEIEEPPLTLIHNDFQLDNLAFELQEVVVLDWAFPMAARGAGDLAFFLVGNLAPDVRRSAEGMLINDYLAALAQGGVGGYSPEQCFQDYQKAILYFFARLLVAISQIENTAERAGKPVDPPAFDFWSPIVNRYLIAFQDHYLMQKS